ncbi:hypothetical protein BDD12DRAFT_879335 [Trichophaea hybrida]|nr:hypothetical protein BDD12DRAFT_879335 [Trichophaea hybrida]
MICHTAVTYRRLSSASSSSLILAIVRVYVYRSDNSSLALATAVWVEAVHPIEQATCLSREIDRWGLRQHETTWSLSASRRPTAIWGENTIAERRIDRTSSSSREWDDQATHDTLFGTTEAIQERIRDMTSVTSGPDAQQDAYGERCVPSTEATGQLATYTFDKPPTDHRDYDRLIRQRAIDATMAVQDAEHGPGCEPKGYGYPMELLSGLLSEIRKIMEIRRRFGWILDGFAAFYADGKQIHWVPGHTGILGNEEADRRANLARAGRGADTVRERVYTSAAKRIIRISEARSAAKAQREADKCIKHLGHREDDKCWYGGTVAKTRKHLFRHCSQWKDEQKKLWKVDGLKSEQMPVRSDF